MQHAIAHAVSFAAVSRIFEQSDRGKPGSVTVHNFSGTVARAIIGYDDFRAQIFSVQVVHDVFEGCAQSLRFIVSRYNDRVLRAGLKFAQVIQSVNTKQRHRE